VRRFSLAGLALLVLLSSSCSKDPTIEERPLVVYSPLACPVAQSEAFSYVYAHGDFDDAPFQSLFLRDVGTTMSTFPTTTRAVVVDISQQSSGDWWGMASVPPEGEVDVLVWPKKETCSLTRIVEQRTEGTLGVFGRHIGIMGGKPVDTPTVPVPFVGDLRTGILEKLELGLLTPRVQPTITAFGTSLDDDPMPALVAAGEDYHGNALSTAEVYVPKKGTPGDLGDFDRTNGVINLSTPRKKHGAVVLRDGSTLLVGGLDAANILIGTMDVIDPKTHNVTSNGLAQLAFPRSNPTVLRLADGQILVAGGINSRGEPVGKLEFFTPDARFPSKKNPVDLVAGSEGAFVPLAGGGALAVIAPPTGKTDVESVWVISPDGSVTAGISLDFGPNDVVRLFEGTGGAPLLWTGYQWFRWDPWFGAFSPVAEQPNKGPCFTRLPPEQTPTCSKSIASGDPGLALWLEQPLGSSTSFVTGWRFDLHTEYDYVDQTFLTTSTAGLAPDRLANQPGGPIQFDIVNGLTLDPGASVFMTDVSFGDFTLDVGVVGLPASVVLRPRDADAFIVGGGACAFREIATKKLHVERKGTRIRVQADDGELIDCPNPLPTAGRVEIGLQGTSGFITSGARELHVSRR
jgi:hypothetical protein